MFDRLAVEIKEVGALEPDTLTDDELTQTVLELGRLETMLGAARNRLLGA